MSEIQHLSMRVPWRDRPWDGVLCDAPLSNSSCTLLANIGIKRDDAFEATHAGAAIDTLDTRRLPCLSERATFMSPGGYSVTKTHPYAQNKALKGMLHPSPVSLPGFAFEAIPFRWLSRKSLYEEIGIDRVPGFQPDAEDHVDTVIGWDPNWVMDSGNQQAVIRTFFDVVDLGESLVFIYMKHSPLQEERTDRLLVGAARVTRVQLPAMWQQSGHPPFSSFMWETIVEHSLRADMTDGILLPYQDLLSLADRGADISGALAWAPEGRDTEFSYVTEHVGDDAAIQALAALDRAARAMVGLGLKVPAAALDWLDTQTARLWQLRGPTPGIASVLDYIGVERAHLAARTLIHELSEGTDPWAVLHSGFANHTEFSSALRPLIGKSIGKIWGKLESEEQQVLQMLSAFDISASQVDMLMTGNTEVELSLADLLSNPYSASICTYALEQHVPFSTVDRACFPPLHVTWKTPLPDSAIMDDNLDRRRLEALLVDVLEARGLVGDTLLGESEAIELANAYSLSRPPTLNSKVLKGQGLDTKSLQEIDEFSPLIGITLEGGTPGLKLMRYDTTSYVIREWITQQSDQPRLGELTNARTLLDKSLAADTVTSKVAALDAGEERARVEKAAGLAELYASPLSVVIGPAGTGKTTLLRALVNAPDVSSGQILLLAPTGKARVQLQNKVGRPAKTLASFLIRSQRYDPDTGRYLVRFDDDPPQEDADLVVIDEASMLTEEMLAAALDALGVVKRLILVGDPRQLPPIGPGRPFVDLVEALRPDAFAEPVHVGPGYVQLRVHRRQVRDGNAGNVRHDLELAAWFGDGDLPAGADQIWEDLRSSPDRPTLRHEPWGTRSASEALADTLASELKLSDQEDAARAFALTYGGTVNGQYLNWEKGAGESAGSWQILSPTRSRAFGTTEINRHIKQTYRAADTQFAQKYFKSNIAAPVGPELIVRGDKVMQTENKKMKAWPAGVGQDYVANGEIGVAIGYIVPAAKKPKKALRLTVEFSSQLGCTYSYWPSKADDPPLELAWAVTVHKSQGSEFTKTFVVLPALAHLSRELIYTALTRQQDRVIIIHEGTLDDLRELTRPWRSETPRRLTDLFQAPEIVTIDVHGQCRRFDRHLIHVTAGGIAVASKNEVIAAAILDEIAPGQWTYEKVLEGKDGRQVLPDFTITRQDGRIVYWEHLGMLDVPDYAEKWKRKRAWYFENGILPHGDGGGTNGILMWTDDRHGVDAQAWTALARSLIGESGGKAPRRSGARTKRQTVLKKPVSLTRKTKS